MMASGEPVTRAMTAARTADALGRQVTLEVDSIDH